MKNLVTTLLGLAFVIVGSNIASMTGCDPPTKLQTVAASTVPQLPLSSMLNNMNRTKPDTVFVHDTISCTHKSQPIKTVIKKTVIKKTDTSYVPLLYIAEPSGDMTDSVAINTITYTVRKAELSDAKQMISKVRK